MTLRDHEIHTYFNNIKSGSFHLAVYPTRTYLRRVTSASANSIDGKDVTDGSAWRYSRFTSHWDCNATIVIPLASIEEAYSLYPEYWL